MATLLWCLLLAGVSTAEGSKNLALGRPASQSSTNNSAIATRAVDGNTNPYLDGASCSLTNEETVSSWKMDLGRHFLVNRIKIFTSMDGIQVSNLFVGLQSDYTDGASFWVAEHAVPPGGVLDLQRPEGVRGRKVYIDIDLSSTGNVHALNLCEVEVYGVIEHTFDLESRGGASSELVRRGARSQMECAVHCLSKDICRSLLWDPSNGECILYGDLPINGSHPDNFLGYITLDSV